jgi:ubiquinone/menaquinone biosynthesis C-methylase UbiE
LDERLDPNEVSVRESDEAQIIPLAQKCRIVKQPSDWRRVWEEKSTDRSISDFELDRGRTAVAKEGHEPRDPELMDFAEPKESEAIFDAGCGTGVNIFWLHSRVRQIIGMDYASGSVVRAQRRIRSATIENAQVLVGSITDIPLMGSSVDKVLCLSVFQYLDDHQVRKALQEFARVLADGGIVVLHVKNLSSLYWSTLWAAKAVKSVFRRGTKTEYLRSYGWYVRELRSANCEILRYSSRNLLIVDRMPRGLVSFLQSFEAKCYGTRFWRTAFVRQHGADLKIKAKLVRAQRVQATT